MNLLIGAISGNYNESDIYAWVNSSNNFNDVERVLLLYNSTNENLIKFLTKNNVKIIQPSFDFWGNEVKQFGWDTGKCDLNYSYNLIHNIRFYHIWYYLKDMKFNKVFITDVKDLYFNNSPFDKLKDNKITATSERIKYSEHQWNFEHIHTNLGIIGIEILSDAYVHNVGAWGGDYNLVKQMCLDIYLMSVGKHKVADQTTFNYLIHTKYYSDTIFTEDLAIHLHVVNEGLIKFNLSDLNKYSIVHQYDRIEGLRYE